MGGSDRRSWIALHLPNPDVLPGASARVDSPQAPSGSPAPAREPAQAALAPSAYRSARRSNAQRTHMNAPLADQAASADAPPRRPRLTSRTSWIYPSRSDPGGLPETHWGAT